MSAAVTIATAIDAVTSLLVLITRAADAAHKISTVIEKARAEGRELTPEEMQEANMLEAKAFARWHELRSTGISLEPPIG